MRHLTLDAGGPVHVVDHGGDGPPMLLVHGLGGATINWHDVATPLTSGHHVWAVDLIGFGETPRAGRVASVEAHQEVVDAVLRAVSPRRPVVLVGNSMGGLVSILEASRRPQRVDRLVLVDPALPLSPGARGKLLVTTTFFALSAPGLGRRALSWHSRRRGAERLVDDILRLCTVDVERISAQTRDLHVALTERRQGCEDAHAAFVEAARSLMRWHWHHEVVADHVRRVRAPTLLVHGDRDRLVDVRAAVNAARLRPDWTFHVLANTGHIPQMERPARFLEVVQRWLGTAQAPAVPASTSRR